MKPKNSEKKDANFKYYLTDKFFSILEILIKVGAGVFCFYLFLDYLDSTFTKILLVVAVMLLITLPQVFNKIYSKKIEQMSVHNRELEKVIDRKRSSSNLTKSGLTSPEDK